MKKKVLFVDQELFVAAMQRAVADGDAGFARDHLAKLDELVADLRARLGELEALRLRATAIAQGRPAMAECG